MESEEYLPFPSKKYSIIYADPPWAYQNQATRAAANKHYNTMTIQDIADLPVANIADENCVLFLWVTFPMLPEAFDIIKAWGFHYKTVAFTWMKENPSGNGLFMGLGNWTRSNAEICLLATRGKPIRANASVSSAILAPRERHSKKPDEVRYRIEQLMGDVSRIELFARQRADGWDAWGNEVPGEEG